MSEKDSKSKQICERVLRVLDAKVEALWKLGEPRDKPKMKVSGPIPVITDIEQDVAFEAVYAIAEKYGINKHDLYMFQQACIMEVYWALGRACPVRLELSEDLFSKITWQ